MRVRRVKDLSQDLAIEGHCVVSSDCLGHKTQNQAGDENGKDLVQDVRGKALQDDGQALILKDQLIELGKVLRALAGSPAERKDQDIYCLLYTSDAADE